MTVNTAIQLNERVSYVSSTTKAKGDGGYFDAKTPVDDIEGGALREGGRPNIWSRDYIGVALQYAAVGVVYGGLPATAYPLLQQYLNVEGTAYVSATVLLNLPWSFKVLYGILSDCFPIFGYRRRPFMMIGWTVCSIMLLIMACSKMGDPYFLDRSLASRKPSTYTPEDLLLLNKSAADSGGKYVILMMFAAVGYVGADVAADGIVVELAQREPEEFRGTIQTTIYMVRTIFVVLASILTGFFLNGEQYGGDFSFSLSFPQLMAIFLVFTVPIIPITWFFIKEEKHPGVNISNYFAEFWELIQSRAMYQVIAYKFFSGLFEKFSITAGSPMASYWAGVTPINDTIAGVLSNTIFAIILFCTGKWGLGWNWRWMHAYTLIAVNIIDSIATFMTTWDVVRSQWFWLGPPLLEQLPGAVGFIVATYVVVELAGEGNEGAVYGLLTTVSNLSSPFASTITKNVDAQFDIGSTFIQEDSHHVRTQVSYALALMYCINLCGLFWLPLLPPQKKETQELKSKGGKSKTIGMLTIFYLTFALCWSVMVNVMSIYPSTSCLKIAGGKGCKKK